MKTIIYLKDIIFNLKDLNYISKGDRNCSIDLKGVSTLKHTSEKLDDIKSIIKEANK